jgi:predicted MPP superfamily phosphohydrolase
MKILLLGDPHFKKSNLVTMKIVTQEVLELIDYHHPDLVISLGDTLDRHESIYMPALVDAINFYNQIAKRTKLVVLVGNHDRINNSDFMSNLQPFVGASNFKVIYEAIWDKEHNFIYVPYVPPGKFLEALKSVDYDPEVSDSHPKYIFAHQEFRNCKMGKKISTSGDIWDKSWPKIYSGHIHEYQRLNNVVYVGTFMQNDYGESDDKAIMILHDEKEIRIPLKSVPRKITFNISPSELESTLNEIDKYENTLIRVIVNVSQVESKSLDNNPLYISLGNKVDKILKKVTRDQPLLGEFKSYDREIPELFLLVSKELEDDTLSYTIWTQEILEV